ncbi:MAG: effector binding domain-containing protein [Virgibacillus proomii]|jgi:predicted transcriptional regulator YdeE
MKLNLLRSIRTNNFNDNQLIKKMEHMWKEASSKLKHHKGNVYGVYYDYESNYKGDYSLGVAINDRDSNVDNRMIMEIPDVKYKIFDVDTTDELGIMKAWSKIWELEESGSLKRAYTYDYEKYDPNGNIEIYIAVRK